jgi:preprotein translocase subunit SecF
MEFLQNTHIDFLRYRRFWVGFSVAVILAGFVEVLIGGPLNLGIDFAGGHQVTLRFANQPGIDQVRGALDAARGGGQVQNFGEGELLVRAPLDPTAEGETAEVIVAAIEKAFPNPNPTALDLNRTGEGGLAALLMQLDPEQIAGRGADEVATERYRDLARALLAERSKVGIFATTADANTAATAAGLSPEVTTALGGATTVGPFAVLSQESVGPQVGSELRSKAVYAVILSLLAMLAYIWLRFELRFAIGATMASIHDVLVTFGLFAIAGFEFNLTTIAAFLTLVGYSVNDTVVVFDRVRENMRLSPRTPLIDTINKSLNQTLSRTILTSGTTLLAAAALFFFGGDVLRGFAFVLAVGVIVGTYSSVYIAGPFALLWEQFEQRRNQATPNRPAPTRPAPTR